MHDSVAYKDAELKAFSWDVHYWEETGEVEAVYIQDSSGLEINMTEALKDSVIGFIEEKITEQIAYRKECG